MVVYFIFITYSITHSHSQNDVSVENSKFHFLPHYYLISTSLLPHFYLISTSLLRFNVAQLNNKIAEFQQKMVLYKQQSDLFRKHTQARIEQRKKYADQAFYAANVIGKGTTSGTECVQLQHGADQALYAANVIVKGHY